MQSNDPEQSAAKKQAVSKERAAAKELNGILARELRARGSVIKIDDVIEYVLRRYQSTIAQLTGAMARKYVRGCLMGLVKRAGLTTDDQVRLFPELPYMPEMLTYPTKEGVFVIKRADAKREHWEAFINYVTAENLRRVENKNAMYVAHNQRLEARRQIFGDLPESELLRLALDEGSQLATHA
jgi:hypothetical protein